ncbi:MAG: hypothetical protein R2731_18555 [Nocardioides sp.]
MPSASPTKAARTTRATTTPAPTASVVEPSVAPASAETVREPSTVQPRVALPLWAVAGVLVALGGAGAGAAYLRRRNLPRGGGSPG